MTVARIGTRGVGGFLRDWWLATSMLLLPWSFFIVATLPGVLS